MGLKRHHLHVLYTHHNRDMYKLRYLSYERYVNYVSLLAAVYIFYLSISSLYVIYHHKSICVLNMLPEIGSNPS